MFGFIGHKLCKPHSVSFPEMISMVVGEEFIKGMLTIASDLAP